MSKWTKTPPTSADVGKLFLVRMSWKFLRAYSQRFRQWQGKKRKYAYFTGMVVDMRRTKHRRNSNWCCDFMFITEYEDIDVTLLDNPTSFEYCDITELQ
jgi:hypothetical protein